MSDPLIEKVDCIHVAVPDLESGLGFYRDKLGHKLVWRTETAAGLSMGSGETEIVIEQNPPDPSTDLLVQSVPEAVDTFVDAGGEVENGPFEIAVGNAAVVRDPWGNRFTLLDLSRGTFTTDADGKVTGVRDRNS